MVHPYSTSPNPRVVQPILLGVASQHTSTSQCKADSAAVCCQVCSSCDMNDATLNVLHRTAALQPKWHLQQPLQLLSPQLPKLRLQLQQQTLLCARPFLQMLLLGSWAALQAPNLWLHACKTRKTQVLLRLALAPQTGHPQQPQVSLLHLPMLQLGHQLCPLTFSPPGLCLVGTTDLPQHLPQLLDQLPKSAIGRLLLAATGAPGHHLPKPPTRCRMIKHIMYSLHVHCLEALPRMHPMVRATVTHLCQMAVVS